jgi:hypothetical protein
MRKAQDQYSETQERIQGRLQHPADSPPNRPLLRHHPQQAQVGRYPDAVPRWTQPPQLARTLDGMARSKFAKLTAKLGRRKGVHNPRALAAHIGRKKLGQAEMTRRSVAGRRRAARKR